MESLVRFPWVPGPKVSSQQAGDLLHGGDDSVFHLATVRTEAAFAVESREQLTSWTPYLTVAGRH